MKTLNDHGSGCRCLIRLWENEGRATLSDEAFIGRYLDLYPVWSERPGLTDDLMLFELAKDLGLAASIAVTRDYDRVIRAFESGQAVLVRTGRNPDQTLPATGEDEQVLLLMSIDKSGFSLWRPFRNGTSDVLPRADMLWWDAWLAVALILKKQAPEVINRGLNAVTDSMLVSSR